MTITPTTKEKPIRLTLKERIELERAVKALWDHYLSLLPKEIRRSPKLMIKPTPWLREQIVRINADITEDMDIKILARDNG